MVSWLLGVCPCSWEIDAEILGCSIMISVIYFQMVWQKLWYICIYTHVDREEIDKTMLTIGEFKQGYMSIHRIILSAFL